MTEHFHFLIIGTGLAGLNAALLAREHGSVCLLSKAPVSETNTNRAQGGIAAAVAATDHPQRHAADTIRAGDGLCDEHAVEILTAEGPAAVRRLIDLGVNFDRTPNGDVALAQEGAHSQPRVLHAGGDRTGRHIQRALEHGVERGGIDLREAHTAVELALEAGRCVGAVIAGPTGKHTTITADATILATGGAGALYTNTTNADIATADGLGLALRAGAVVRDLEFVQFHPTALAGGDGPAFLVSEALRGEGAVLLDAAGNRFLADIHPDAELAPRSVIARAISESMRRDDAPNVWLDISHQPADFLRTRFPGVYQGCLERGHDLTAGPVPVAPAAHYHMGGVWTDLHGRTTIPGLFAAGEVAATGAHGANRVASNSLLEAAVFSARAINAATGRTADAPTPAEPVEPLPISGVGAAPSLAQLQQTITGGAGIARHADELTAALRRLESWSANPNSDTPPGTDPAPRHHRRTRHHPRRPHPHRDPRQPPPTRPPTNRSRLAAPPRLAHRARVTPAMPDLSPLDEALVERLVQDSLDEDRVDLDLTTQSIAASLSDGTAELIARTDGVICGLAFATAAFEALDPDVEIIPHCADGDAIAAGDVLATIRGRVLDLLRAERTALNWLQRLSGTATLTAAAVAAAAAGGHAQILDTRKTTPGLRAAERYAVRCGGGLNHRDSLAAGILLKDNHIAAVGSITEAVHAALEHSGPATAVEVEVANIDQAREALDAGAPALLLDNFAIGDLPRAVELAHRFDAAVEASGGIAITQITEIAATGVDYISMGALTHSAPALDIALDLRP